MAEGTLGTLYKDGAVIVREGDPGDCMFVVQAGQVEVIQGDGEAAQRIAVISKGGFFGEMAIFETELRSATVRSVGDSRVLKVDKKALLRRITEDPLLALNLLRTLSARLRQAAKDKGQTR